MGPDTEARPGTPEECHFVATANPLSGALGAVGLALENAARLAVRDVNMAGGVGGKKLCLIACDTRTDATSVQPTIDGIIAQYDGNIVALNGAAASSASLKAAESTLAAGIPQVSCCSTSPELSNKDNAPTFMRTVPSDALQGLVLASLPAPQNKVAVIYINDSYGRPLSNVFEAEFKRQGGTITNSVPYEPGVPGYYDVIEAALDPVPDHVVLIAFPTDGAQIMRDWRTSALGPSVRWLATDGLQTNKFVLGAGPGTADTVVGTAPVLRGKHFASFAERYRAAFGGEEPGIFTSNQYDAVMLIALGLAHSLTTMMPLQAAIRRVSSAEPADVEVSPNNVADALRAAAAGDVNYSGASGEVELDANGDVTLADYVVWEVSSDDEIVNTDTCWRCQVGRGCSLGCN